MKEEGTDFSVEIDSLLSCQKHLYLSFMVCRMQKEL